MLLLAGLLSLVFAQNPEYRHLAGETPAVLVVIPTAPETVDSEWKSWSEIATSRKWHLVIPTFRFNGDDGVHKLEAMVKELRNSDSLNQAPFYLVGGGPATTAVFYAAARAPHLWSAALAIGGNPKPAIDSDRLYAANVSTLPIAWALTEAEKTESRSIQNKFRTAQFELTVLDSPTIGEALDFLAKHPYVPFPPKVDCEIGNPTLGRCYWMHVTKFDPSLRNDALRSTRLPPDLQASLDFGGFGYEITAPGPGVLIEYLPENYKGPLQLKDRIVALSGKPIVDAAHYVELMSQVKEEKPVSVTIQRGDERLRITTSYRLPQRFEVVTVRIQGHYFPESQEVLLVSRGVASVEVTPNPAWKVAAINWNGNRYELVSNPACAALSLNLPGAVSPCKNGEP